MANRPNRHMKRDDHRSFSKPAPPSSNANNGQGGPKNPEQARLPPRKAWLLFAVILLVNYVIVKTFFPDANAPVTVPYTVFKQEVAKGNVKSIYSQGANIEGQFAAPVTWPTTIILFVTTMFTISVRFSSAWSSDQAPGVK